MNEQTSSDLSKEGSPSEGRIPNYQFPLDELAACQQGAGTEVSGSCVVRMGLRRGAQGNKSLWGRAQN